MSGPKRGFTLIELLVVIAIIAILAAILFPVFAKARAKAYQTTCVNNQRQLAVAIQMYVQDNDESFPLPGDWVSAVNMAKDPKIFDCPSSTSAGSPSKPDYGMNAVLYENINGVKSQLALGSIENPEMTELTSDMAYMTGATITVDNPFANAAVVNSFYGSNAEARHTNAFVVSYVDGHVASVKQAKDMGLSFFSLPTAAGRVFVDFSKLTAATAPAAAASIFSTNGASEQGYLPAAPNAPVGSFNSLSKTWDINGALTQSAWTGNTTASIIYTAKTATPMGYSLIVQGDCGSGTRVRLSNCNPRIASNLLSRAIGPLPTASITTASPTRCSSAIRWPTFP